MPVFGPFESRIVVNEHALPEYEEKEEADATGLKMITCWIPSEVDQVRLSSIIIAGELTSV
jgi:hypothetical protein